MATSPELEIFKIDNGNGNANASNYEFRWLDDEK